MNDGAGDGNGIAFIDNNDKPHFNRISDLKCCGMVGTAHAVSC